MVKLEKHIKEERYMFTLTEEQKKKIEELYNYYWELYLEQETEECKSLYLGKCFGMESALSYLGYKFKSKYCVIPKEEE